MAHKKMFPIKKLLNGLKKMVNPPIPINIETNSKQVRVIQLIQAYRNRGHQKANLDPLGLKKIRHCDDLDINFLVWIIQILSESFNTDIKIDKSSATLSEGYQSLERYIAVPWELNITIFLPYLRDRGFKIDWRNLGKLNFDQDEQKYILKRLSSAEGLAKFLASRYPGMKRFGIDGAESLIPLVDSLIQNCGILVLNKFALVWRIEDD